MSLNPADIFARHLPDPLPDPIAAEVFAPSNIALAKYWGKRDKALNLPMNSSLSISLGGLGTTTRITGAAQDTLIFNGQALPSASAAAAKIWSFVALFRPNGPPLRIETQNSIPTAAGLASSASGFAALTLALNAAFQTKLPLETLSQLARFGSGSATRSFWHGFVRWAKGDAPDGSDSHGHALSVDWPEFRIALLPVDTGPKAQSSRDGMAHTLATSPLYAAWPAQAEADCDTVERAVKEQDFRVLGPIVEANALAMHATMMAARPALSYLKAASWARLDALWAARAEGLEAYATADAGPNIKLIFLASQTDDVQTLFPDATVIAPFNERRDPSAP